jgi:hypothetical protein
VTEQPPFRLFVELTSTDPPVGQLRLANVATHGDVTDGLGFNGWMELLSALEHAIAKPTNPVR